MLSQHAPVYLFCVTEVKNRNVVSIPVCQFKLSLILQTSFLFWLVSKSVHGALFLVVQYTIGSLVAALVLANISVTYSILSTLGQSEHD